MERYIRIKYSEAAIFDIVSYSIDYAPSYKNTHEEKGAYDSYRGKKSFSSFNKLEYPVPNLRLIDAPRISYLKFNSDKPMVDDVYIFNSGISPNEIYAAKGYGTELCNRSIVNKLLRKRILEKRFRLFPENKFYKAADGNFN